MLKIIKCASVLVLVIFLTNCGGGSSSGDSDDSDDMQEMLVSPSLGLIQNPTIRLSQLDNTQITITTTFNADGSILVSFPANITGPIVIEIQGNNGAVYFDEASGSFQPFGPGESIRHILASPRSTVGVTALTDFAALLLDQVPTPNATSISQANEFIRTALAPSMNSIVISPQIIGSAADLAALDASESGEYAAILAALANLHNNPASPSPALEVINQLGEDILNGTIDGLDANDAAINNLVYNAGNFVNDFTAAVNTVDDGTPLDGNDYMTVNVNVGRFPAISPAQWTITLDAQGPGIHEIFMIADVGPLVIGDVQALSGNLIWNQTQIDLCVNPNSPPNESGTFISVRSIGVGSLSIGDGFESNTQGTGCSINAAMENAFINFGLPVNACLTIRTGNVDYEYCAPLEVL